MKRYNIAPGEHLHIYNRGVFKRNIFLNDRDRRRFLFLIFLFQSPDTLKNTDRIFKDFLQGPELYLKNQDKILKNRYVELIAFCLMPNHFHLIVHELKDGGIAKYMQRIQNAFTKYFNTKYEKSGHLFQGPYKAVRVEDNEQLLHLSSYIHKNPVEIFEWKNKILEFPWSSHQDYVLQNRWGNFLKNEIIISQFDSKKNSYEKFVRTSLAKEL